LTRPFSKRRPLVDCKLCILEPIHDAKGLEQTRSKTKAIDRILHKLPLLKKYKIFYFYNNNKKKAKTKGKFNVNRLLSLFMIIV